MKTRYRIIRRGNRGDTFYCVDAQTRKRTSLNTSDLKAARRIVEAKNQAEEQPAINRQLSEANRYSGQTQQGLDMGAAESGQMQGNEAALANHKRDLQSYGIDPSSGRYAGLDEAARVQAAAGAVGAAQQARQFDVTTGQNLPQQGINNASQAAIAENAGVVNDYNTALQGFAGSENAGLANANTGVALTGAASPFLNTAASYKPVVGTNSTSSSSGSSQGSSSGQSQTTDPAQQPKDQSQPKDPSQQQQTQPSSNTGSGSGGSGSGSSSSTAPFQEGDNTATDAEGDFPFNGSLDTSGNDSTQQDFTDNSGTGSADNFGLDYSGGSTYGFDSSGNMDSSGYSDTGAIDYGGGSSDSGYFAEGGAIPEDGGPVPTSASPSHGAVTDDVRAQLPSGKQINVNAREFVIPEDVARWKGEEFFQKLIAQSRQARVTAPARPSNGMQQHG